METRREFIRDIVIGISFLLTGCSFYDRTSFIQKRIFDGRLNKEVSASGKREIIGKDGHLINVLYLSGTPYEMGYQHGRLIGKEVNENIHGVLRGFQESVKKNLEGFTKLPLLEDIISGGFVSRGLGLASEKIWSRMPREDQEELIGLADGSKVNLNLLKMVHSLPEVVETSCSLISAYDKASIDKKMYQVRVLDFAMNLGIQDNPAIIVYQPKNQDSFRFANIGWAGFIGVISGMNGKGVCVSEAGYGSPRKNKRRMGISASEEDYQETIDGMPMEFQLKEVLRHSENVDQATAILRSVNKTSDYAFIVSDPKDTRGYISTRNMLKVIKPGETAPVKVFDNVVYGSHDDKKCSELIDQYYGHLEPKIFIDNIIPLIAMKGNLQSVVYYPAELKFWVANAKGRTGRACDQKYIEFKLN